MQGSRVLVAEDDTAVRESLDRALRFNGYEVFLAADGSEALSLVGQEDPELIILDVMMPNVDGLTVCRRVRAQGIATPILMLTARHLISDRVAGLDAGADDYLVKPFALEELRARVRALLRRTGVTGGSDVLEMGDLRLDPSGRSAERAGIALELTKTEFDLLELLLFNAGVVLPRSRIYEEIWGFDFETSSKSLDVYIGYLRRKTEPEGMRRLIHTVRGVGYVMRTS